MEFVKVRKKPVEVYAARLPTEVNIPTLEGTMKGLSGDYLIIGVHGEIYPCAAAIFEETYDVVDQPEETIVEVIKSAKPTNGDMIKKERSENNKKSKSKGRKISEGHLKLHEKARKLKEIYPEKSYMQLKSMAAKILSEEKLQKDNEYMQKVKEELKDPAEYCIYGCGNRAVPGKEICQDCQDGLESVRGTA